MSLWTTASSQMVSKAAAHEQAVHHVFAKMRYPARIYKQPVLNWVTYREGKAAGWTGSGLITGVYKLPSQVLTHTHSLGKDAAS